MRTTLAALPLLLIAAGCAELGDLRATPPALTQTVRGDFEAIAQCVADAGERTTGQGVPTLRIDRARGIARLYRIIEGGSNAAAYELSFQQQAGRAVLVEGRGMATVRGRAFPFEHLWPHVARCAEG